MSHESTTDAINRRGFLKVLGVTGAGAAVVSGCSTSKVEKLIPYLVQSEDQVPGIPTWYASTCTECAAGCGLHVKTREGRAIKLEGNPHHPVNAGRLCSHGQSALQGLYNPGRVKGPMARQADGSLKEITWDEAIALLAGKLQGAAGKVAVISGAGRGTFSDLLAAWTAAQGGQLVRYQPFAFEAIRAASQQVFGLSEVPAYDFAAAKYIVSFGADFLESWVSPVEHQRGFAESHGFSNGEMAKHVWFAPRMSLTGLNADEWHAPRPGSEAAIALAMANVLLAERSGNPADANGLRGALAAWTPEKAQEATGVGAEIIRRVAREFASAQPSLAVAGGVGNQHRGAAELCAAVNLLNYIAGNVGRTVKYGADLDTGDGYAALLALVEAIDKGGAQVVIVHDANPAYSLPKAAGFEAKFKKAPFKVSTSLYLDETAALCDLLLPDHHALERWDDLRPRKGVNSLLQPVMEPVFKTMATGDVLLKVSQKAGGSLAPFNATSWEAHLKAQWAKNVAGEAGWRDALAKGGLYGEAPVTPVKLAAGAGQVSYTAPAFDGEAGDAGFWLAPAASVMGDGRFTNRPLLLELSDPVTKITWHSWVEMHPETAQRLDVREGEIVVLTSPAGSIEAPVYIYPGIHPDVLGVPLGWGHTSYGEFATGRGANPLDLLDAKPAGSFLAYFGTRVTVGKTRKFHKVGKTEGNTRQLGRGIADAMTLDQAKKGLTPALAAKEEGHEEHEVNTEREVEAIKGFRESQLEKRKHGAYAAADLPMWGMTIDLSRCTGCSACVTACYVENNIPQVGYDDILRGREMTWMRIERYWEGGEHGEPLEARFVPMLCQHCDNAPCEPVCPVYAAYHTPDGLNGQVYNRCVGTRYCANNCPYKVRYFNWYAYNKKAFPEPLNLALNPDVTVRARGVMEKCTFCVQRIRGAQHQARLEDRKLADGDVVTACAQACPSNAIVFGDTQDPASRVSQVREDHRGYHILEDLNVRPAVTYLAKVLHHSEA
ncbi:MAG TPA: molybdopterin-dependent oxidoreductase [Gemmatimonadales bacterium]|nr:molybdopterin-dependent oxidoreductase [Gemmatimonadales bacterium]